MDWEYAYNYWRKIFVDSSRGRFKSHDFDEWFRNGSDPKTYSVGYFGPDEQPGSPEDFSYKMRAAFIEMLKACADGRFGK